MPQIQDEIANARVGCFLCHSLGELRNAFVFTVSHNLKSNIKRTEFIQTVRPEVFLHPTEIEWSGNIRRRFQSRAQGCEPSSLRFYVPLDAGLSVTVSVAVVPFSIIPSASSV